jgi:hypothetical protein
MGAAKTGETFNQAMLLRTEDLAAELTRRATLNEDLLRRLAGAVNNQTLDVYVFLSKNGPANRLELETSFSRQNLDRVIPILEAENLIVKGANFKYRAQK